MRRPAPCEQDLYDAGFPLPGTMYERVPIEPGMTPSVADVGLDRTLAGDPEVSTAVTLALR